MTQPTAGRSASGGVDTAFAAAPAASSSLIVTARGGRTSRSDVGMDASWGSGGRHG
ncbi:hypothetical protein AB0C40_02210 [Streptomyces brevispora]|uniref:hypothetical protein n=1 Tax=Streptomyces brevispora TaxID=887462 RepID=UPI0033DB20E8